MTVFEMKQTHHAALTRADSTIAAAEAANRALTPAETETVDAAMAEAAELAPKIATLEKKSILRAMFPGGRVLTEAPSSSEAPSLAGKKVLSREYATAFAQFIGSGGQNVSSALYEGSGPSGGYAVPLVVDDQIVPLAPHDMSIRQLATIIPTVSDIKIPRKTTFGVAGGR